MLLLICTSLLVCDAAMNFSSNRPAADLIPGGIIDPLHKTIYVSDPAGYLLAIEPLSGKIKWNTDLRCDALIADATQVIVVSRDESTRNQWHVISLDSTNGKPRSAARHIVKFPNNVLISNISSVEPGLDVSLENNHLTINWDMEVKYTGGAPPPRGQKSTQRCQGGLTVDLTSGRISESAKAERPFTDAVGSISSAAYLEGTVWKTKPIMLDKNHFVYFSLEDQQDHQVFTYHRASQGNSSPEKTIRLLDGKSIAAHLTLDRAHVWISDGKSVDMFQVFRLSDGQSLGKFARATSAMRDVAVHGKLLFLDEIAEGTLTSSQGQQRHRNLVVMDIDKKTQLWKANISPTPSTTPYLKK